MFLRQVCRDARRRSPSPRCSPSPARRLSRSPPTSPRSSCTTRASPRRSSPPTAHVPTAYRRTVRLRDGGAWVQYWLYYRYQDQDRGVVRSGRHEGDWELVQFRVTASGRPVEAVYAQHSGAERCAASELDAPRRPSGRLRVARLPRLLPARGRARPAVAGPERRGRRARRSSCAPRVVEVTASSPPFMRRSTPWGASRAAWWMPLEQSSPPGPAFQPDRWDDPAAFAASARLVPGRTATRSASATGRRRR